MTDEDDFITVVQAAQLRQVTAPCVYRWIAEGRLLKETRFGQAVVSRSQVLALEMRANGRPPESVGAAAPQPELPVRRRRQRAGGIPPAERPKAKLIKQRKQEQ